MKAPRWLYRRIDRTGHVPDWAYWFWPKVHWCPKMDDLLILDNVEDCFCGYVPRPPQHPNSRCGL